MSWKFIEQDSYLTYEPENVKKNTSVIYATLDVPTERL